MEMVTRSRRSFFLVNRARHLHQLRRPRQPQHLLVACQKLKDSTISRHCLEVAGCKSITANQAPASPTGFKAVPQRSPLSRALPTPTSPPTTTMAPEHPRLTTGF